jgi:hypothetical protein
VLPHVKGQPSLARRLDREHGLVSANRRCDLLFAHPGLDVIARGHCYGKHSLRLRNRSTQLWLPIRPPAFIPPVPTDAGRACRVALVGAVANGVWLNLAKFARLS